MVGIAKSRRDGLASRLIQKVVFKVINIWFKDLEEDLKRQQHLRLDFRQHLLVEMQRCRDTI